MKILKFISRGQVPSREMLMDSHRLGDTIVFNLGPNDCFGKIAFGSERLRGHGKNGEWFVDFRSMIDGPSTFMYLSTHYKKAFTVDEKFRFPCGENEYLNDDALFLLCHLTEFKSPELNERILDYFIKTAYSNGKKSQTESNLKKLVDFFKIFKLKADTLFPVVQKLIFKVQ